MGVMSIREFNANSSKAFAKVEAGETLDITKNGKVFAEIRPKQKNRMDDPDFQRKWESMIDRKSTRLNSSHLDLSRMPSSA